MVKEEEVQEQEGSVEEWREMIDQWDWSYCHNPAVKQSSKQLMQQVSLREII